MWKQRDICLKYLAGIYCIMESKGICVLKSCNTFIKAINP
jgi:hypothetical protein